MLFEIPLGDVKIHSIDLWNKYEKYFNTIEFMHGIESFKRHIFALDKSLRDMEIILKS